MFAAIYLLCYFNSFYHNTIKYRWKMNRNVSLKSKSEISLNCIYFSKNIIYLKPRIVINEYARGVRDSPLAFQLVGRVTRKFVIRCIQSTKGRVSLCIWQMTWTFAVRMGQLCALVYLNCIDTIYSRYQKADLTLYISHKPKPLDINPVHFA